MRIFFGKMGELFTHFDKNILILRKIAKNSRLFSGSGLLSSGECRGFYVVFTAGTESIIKFMLPG